MHKYYGVMVYRREGAYIRGGGYNQKFTVSQNFTNCLTLM